jgi:hypothetical protein
LPTQTTVATFVEEPSIQVCRYSWIPVLPNTGTPSPTRAPEPVPDMTPSSVYAAVEATASLITRLQVVWA